jgi:hypothetical protein
MLLAGVLTACGGGSGKESGKESATPAEEASVAREEAGEEAVRAKQRVREAIAAKREEAIVQTKRRKREAAIAAARAQAEAKKTANQKHAHTHKRSSHSNSSNKQKTSKSKTRPTKATGPTESASEKAARQRLAAEEAKEVAANARPSDGLRGPRRRVPSSPETAALRPRAETLASIHPRKGATDDQKAFTNSGCAASGRGAAGGLRQLQLFQLRRLQLEYGLDELQLEHRLDRQRAGREVAQGRRRCGAVQAGRQGPADAAAGDQEQA